MKKVFVSWSGGKDCLYAMHRFLENKENSVVALVNMCRNEGKDSGSHGLPAELIRQQAVALGVPILQEVVGEGGYEESFKRAIRSCKEQGATAGIFGDLYLETHRVWIERVMAEMEMEALFPLWGIDTSQLIRDFVGDGYKTIIVAVRKSLDIKDLLGRTIDEAVIDELAKKPDFDLCGEHGEYHSFVYDGPLFHHPVPFELIAEREDAKHYYRTIGYAS